MSLPSLVILSRSELTFVTMLDASRRTNERTRAFTFPLGVFATSTTALAKELNSSAFKVLGTILSAAVVALWLVVMGLTVQKAWVGTL